MRRISSNGRRPQPTLTSGQSVKLAKTSIEGVKESAALKSQELASSGIRLANNLEIGVEVCSNLIQQSRQSLEVLKEVDLPDSAKLALAQLNSNMTLMTNTVILSAPVMIC